MAAVQWQITKRAKKSPAVVTGDLCAVIGVVETGGAIFDLRTGRGPDGAGSGEGGKGKAGHRPPAGRTIKGLVDGGQVEWKLAPTDGTGEFRFDRGCRHLDLLDGPFLSENLVIRVGNDGRDIRQDQEDARTGAESGQSKNHYNEAHQEKHAKVSVGGPTA